MNFDIISIYVPMAIQKLSCHIGSQNGCRCEVMYVNKLCSMATCEVLVTGLCRMFNRSILHFALKFSAFELLLSSEFIYLVCLSNVMSHDVVNDMKL